MNKKLYTSKRPGALGAVMDLYEQESDLFFDMMKTVKEEDWTTIKDAETKDEDCRSIQTICQHMVGAGRYYIELMKQGENPEHKIEQPSINLANKADFEIEFRAVLETQSNYFEGRWNMSDEEIDAIQIKTGWGNILDPETLMEHAVVHVMRHHRQILKFIN